MINGSIQKCLVNVGNFKNFIENPYWLKTISVQKIQKPKYEMYLHLCSRRGRLYIRPTIYPCVMYIVHTMIWVGGRLLRTFIIIWVAWPLIHFDIEKKMSQWGWNPFGRNICSYFFASDLFLNFHNLMPFFNVYISDW